MVVDPYKASKRYTVTDSLDLFVSFKQIKPNKNFLKLKCDLWCSYFDTTDGYLLFMSFYLHRKFSIFLRNNSNCKAVSYDKHILASKLLF